MEQQRGSEDPTLCHPYALTLLRIRRRTADLRVPRNLALLPCCLAAWSYDLIGDGDICKIFSLVTLLLRYSNAVKRQKMLGPQDKVRKRGPCNSIGIFRIWLW